MGAFRLAPAREREVEVTMKIDYNVAGKWANHVRALAIIESQEDDEAIGDGGRAFGLLQMHPARFVEEVGTFPKFPLREDDDWTTAQIKAAACYFERMQHQELQKVVEAWNLGTVAVFAHGLRNRPYFNRWEEAYSAVEEENIGAR
jgi:hypothetical protein